MFYLTNICNLDITFFQLLGYGVKVATVHKYGISQYDSSLYHSKTSNEDIPVSEFRNILNANYF
jgi:hypothetical protein